MLESIVGYWRDTRGTKYELYIEDHSGLFCSVKTTRKDGTEQYSPKLITRQNQKIIWKSQVAFELEFVDKLDKSARRNEIRWVRQGQGGDFLWSRIDKATYSNGLRRLEAKKSPPAVGSRVQHPIGQTPEGKGKGRGQEQASNRGQERPRDPVHNGRLRAAENSAFQMKQPKVQETVPSASHLRANAPTFVPLLLPAQTPFPHIKPTVHPTKPKADAAQPTSKMSQEIADWAEKTMEDWASLTDKGPECSQPPELSAPPPPSYVPVKSTVLPPQQHEVREVQQWEGLDDIDEAPPLHGVSPHEQLIPPPPAFVPVKGAPPARLFVPNKRETVKDEVSMGSQSFSTKRQTNRRDIPPLPSTPECVPPPPPPPPQPLREKTMDVPPLPQQFRVKTIDVPPPPQPFREETTDHSASARGVDDAPSTDAAARRFKPSRFKVGDHVMADFYGSGLYKATVQAIWPEIGQVQVLWDEEYSISDLPISYLQDPGFAKGDHVMANFYGEYHPGIVYNIWPDTGRVQVLWDNENSISDLCLNDLIPFADFAADAEPPTESRSEEVVPPPPPLPSLPSSSNSMSWAEPVDGPDHHRNLDEKYSDSEESNLSVDDVEDMTCAPVAPAKAGSTSKLDSAASTEVSNGGPASSCRSMPSSSSSVDMELNPTAEVPDLPENAAREADLPPEAEKLAEPETAQEPDLPERRRRITKAERKAEKKQAAAEEKRQLAMQKEREREEKKKAEEEAERLKLEKRMQAASAKAVAPGYRPAAKPRPKAKPKPKAKKLRKAKGKSEAETALKSLSDSEAEVDDAEESQYQDCVSDNEDGGETCSFWLVKEDKYCCRHICTKEVDEVGNRIKVCTKHLCWLSQRGRQLEKRAQYRGGRVNVLHALSSPHSLDSWNSSMYNPEVLELLVDYALAKGVDPKGKDENERTPLSFAASVFTKIFKLNITGARLSSKMLAEELGKHGIEGTSGIEGRNRAALEVGKVLARKWKAGYGDVSADYKEMCDLFAQFTPASSESPSEASNELMQKVTKAIDNMCDHEESGGGCSTCPSCRRKEMLARQMEENLTQSSSSSSLN
mmetsp:Transcript_16563/g.29953  ORF Transcript_16563/g.29953 Transcript_16563/m.29953 type:complete len:1072 (-) Transcript_16563:226-3441(-)